MKATNEIAKEIAENTKLIQFFIEFCDQRSVVPLATGVTCESNCGKYQIEYLEYIPSNYGGIHPTPVRIHNSFPYYLQVSKQKLDENSAPADTVLALLIQCWAQNIVEGEGYICVAEVADVVMLETMNIVVASNAWMPGFVKFLSMKNADLTNPAVQAQVQQYEDRIKYLKIRQ